VSIAGKANPDQSPLRAELADAALSAGTVAVDVTSTTGESRRWRADEGRDALVEPPAIAEVRSSLVVNTNIISPAIAMAAAPARRRHT
jgi:hypothetical protein